MATAHTRAKHHCLRSVGSQAKVRKTDERTDTTDYSILPANAVAVITIIINVASLMTGLVSIVIFYDNPSVADWLACWTQAQ